MVPIVRAFSWSLESTKMKCWVAGIRLQDSVTFTASMDEYPEGNYLTGSPILPVAVVGLMIAFNLKFL